MLSCNGFLNVEAFSDYSNNSQWDLLWPNYVGNHANDCYKLNNSNCLKYSNCGVCIKNGKTQCVPGDIDGPFFKDNCKYWTYDAKYGNNVISNKEITTTLPWNKFYPEFEVRYPSPTSIFTL